MGLVGPSRDAIVHAANVGARVHGWVPGFARLRRDALVGNACRERLLEAIRREPGISAATLHRHMGGGWSTTVYHLSVLSRSELVTSIRDGRHRRYFPADAGALAQRQQIAALSNPRTRLAFEALLEDPGLDRAQMARCLGVRTPSALWHLWRLERAGLVGHERQGRHVTYFPLARPPIPAPHLQARGGAATADPIQT